MIGIRKKTCYNIFGLPLPENNTAKKCQSFGGGRTRARIFFLEIDDNNCNA